MAGYPVHVFVKLVVSRSEATQLCPAPSGLDTGSHNLLDTQLVFNFFFFKVRDFVVQLCECSNEATGKALS